MPGDGGKDWSVVRGRKERRRVNPVTKRRADTDRKNVDKPKGPGRLKRARNRPEAILVKVGQGKEWIQVYSEMMRARDALKDSNGIRRTRAGDILIELKAGSDVRKITTELNTALGGRVSALLMRDKTSVEIKEIDLLMNKEELAMELVEQLGIKDSGEVEVKTLKLAPWGTQSAIVTLPKAYLAKDRSSLKIRTGLTIATIRILPNVVKCYKCHMFGHMANKCTAISPGKEVCRKCGGRDHTIAACNNASYCAICSKETGVRFDHVTGTLACPGYRRLLRKKK